MTRETCVITCTYLLKLVLENNQHRVTASSENSIKTARKMPLPQIPGVVTANLLDEPLNYALANDNY